MPRSTRLHCTLFWTRPSTPTALPKDPQWAVTRKLSPSSWHWRLHSNAPLTPDLGTQWTGCPAVYWGGSAQKFYPDTDRGDGLSPTDSQSLWNMWERAVLCAESEGEQTQRKKPQEDKGQGAMNEPIRKQRKGVPWAWGVCCARETEAAGADRAHLGHRSQHAQWHCTFPPSKSEHMLP